MSAVRVELRGGGQNGSQDGRGTGADGPDGELTVAALSGEITSVTAPALRERLLALVPVRGRLRLDLSQVTYVSSAGLRVLVLLHRQARDRQAAVELAGLSQELRFVMEATGFLDLLTLVPDQDSAPHAPGSDVPDANTAAREVA